MGTKTELYQRAVDRGFIEGLTRSDFVDGIINAMGIEQINGVIYTDKSGGRWRFHRETKRYWPYPNANLWPNS